MKVTLFVYIHCFRFLLIFAFYLSFCSVWIWLYALSDNTRCIHCGIFLKHHFNDIFVRGIDPVLFKLNIRFHIFFYFFCANAGIIYFRKKKGHTTVNILRVFQITIYMYIHCLRWFPFQIKTDNFASCGMWKNTEEILYNFTPLWHIKFRFYQLRHYQCCCYQK